MTLQIGIARADITPPVGIAMVGFAGRDVARDVHDPLYATALVVDDGDTRLVLISLDLLQLMAGTVDAYRARIATITGNPPCLLYTSPSPRDRTRSRMPSSA